MKQPMSRALHGIPPSPLAADMAAFRDRDRFLAPASRQAAPATMNLQVHS